MTAGIDRHMVERVAALTEGVSVSELATHELCTEHIDRLSVQVLEQRRRNYWLGVALLVAIPFALVGFWALVTCVFVPVEVSP